MKNIVIGIVDYGFGNIPSLYSCLMQLGFRVNISAKKSVLKKSDILFLPGVGSFEAGMNSLNQSDLAEFIVTFSKSGKAIIGICLGMQMLFSGSEEGSPVKGLSLLPGYIKKIESGSAHIGWNSIQATKSRSIFKEFDNKEFYFNHTFAYRGISRITDSSSVISQRNEVISSVVNRRNIYGLQFHPEKSQNNGSRLLNKIILKNFNA